MTSILAVFGISFTISLMLTPLARWLGIRWGALDVPDGRKIHAKPMPRIGGLAIFISFMAALAAAMLLKTNVTNLLVLDRPTVFFFVGALIVFGIGLGDDFHRVHSGVKFFFQLTGASVAFWGGVKIAAITVLASTPFSPVTSYVLTVLWFVLIINTINLADGMDGLAGGIALFASVIIIILNILKGDYLPALLFAALGGATLGFLRYNFNPASIFLGDGGSYFLGYMIAGLSIIGYAKAQMGAILLIPVLALGVPLFDTLLAPLRRFIRGQRIFSPDRGHIHHRLVEMGLTTKTTVWVLYGISCVLCILAVILVNLRNEQAGLFLILIGVGAVIFVRKLGYFEYFAADKIYGWLRDMTDATGLSHERRSFLNLQMDMAASKNLEGLWTNVVRAMEMLKFDVAEMALNRLEGGEAQRSKPMADGWKTGIRERGNATMRSPVGYPSLTFGIQGHEHALIQTSAAGGWQAMWVRPGFDRERDLCGESLLKLELPLIGEDGENLGTLWLVKDLKQETVTHFTLRRVEHLRRTLIAALTGLWKV